ncbi:extracellular solute-binding protein [Vineibacter terrae]|uniref:Extracellular solute-binding protein n=1 Tax=Vineibacter terrae TaxID=2586908 RepID=A0A5C8PTZ6_9HYPH|nr:extracellular solute-binding protein [Vineibacter terrae]TXL81686.1 extracellular solute-binding protein [Vineibacter terrae]
MATSSIGQPRRQRRRQFLRTAAGSAAGLAGVLASRQPPAYAQARELTFLTVASFVPETDKELKRQLEEWGALNKVKVRLDIIAHLQLQAKKAAEVQARSGHDLTALGPGLGDAELYFDHLVGLNDVAAEIGRKNGGWLNPDDYLIRGTWTLLPWWQPPFPMAVRTDLLKKLGEENPDTWEDWLRIGKKGKAIGHPFGIALGHSGDANVTLLSILWSYGGSYVAKDGETVTINSPETREAMEFVKRLYTEAMDPEVLAWDDASNNRCLNAGKCIGIHNPISAFESAKKDKVRVPGTQQPIAEVIDHLNTPRGPKGRKATTGFWCVGIWNFAKNAELAKDFLRFHFRPENLDKWVEAGHGFNMPFLNNLTRHPVYESDPQYRHIPDVAKVTVPPSWPGPTTAASQQVLDLYIIPDMFAQYATGRMTLDQAISWGEKEITEIYRRRRT